MDLKDLRDEIDRLDIEIQKLFETRMDVVGAVAAYKKEHDLPVLHQNREDHVLEMVASRSRAEYQDLNRALFTNMMDISKCSQTRLIDAENHYLRESIPFCTKNAKKIACQGVPGAYSHIAANTLFDDEILCFYPQFEDVFRAVTNGDADFGVLPMENSNAGSVVGVYELLKTYNIYIAKRISIPINHCLATLPQTTLSQIKEIYSHEQAIEQCSHFLGESGLKVHRYTNTAASAELVASSDPADCLAVICSKLAAKRYGLTVVKEGINNISENYTRFVVISKTPCHDPNADRISVSFSLPHTAGSLYRTLTKFFVYNVNMEKIESKPIGTKNFDAMFYIDFTGNLNDPNVTALINDLSTDLIDFKYLGNYSEITE